MSFLNSADRRSIITADSGWTLTTKRLESKSKANELPPVVITEQGDLAVVGQEQVEAARRRMIRQAPQPPKPGSRAAKRAERQAQRKAETLKRRASRHAAYERMGYTNVSNIKESIVGSGVGLAVVSTGFFSGVLSPAYATIGALIPAAVLGEALAAGLTIGMLLLAVRIAPVVGGIAKWVLGKVYKHSARRLILGSLTEKWQQRYLDYVEKPIEKAWDGLNTAIESIPVVGDLYGLSNDINRFISDCLDFKKPKMPRLIKYGRDWRNKSKEAEQPVQATPEAVHA